MTEKIELKKLPNDDHVITQEFNVGKIAPSDRDDSKYMLVPMSVTSAMYMMSETMKRMDQENPAYETNFESALEEYCKYWLLDKLGMVSYPLQYNAKGDIQGLKGEYAVEC